MMLKNEIKILLYKYYYNFNIKFIYKNTMEDNTSIEMLLKSEDYTKQPLIW
jgi:hypothetical protein